MSALRNLVVVESRLFVREPVGAFFGIAFPAVLVVVLGSAIPAFTQATPELGGRRLIDIYLPVVLAMAIASVAMITLLNPLAVYRERGVLRRLSSTPVSPSSLLTAQLIVNVAALVIGSVAAFVAARLRFGTPLPADPVAFGVAFLLGAAAMGVVALLIAAVTPSARAASGIGTLVYFPMMFFAGVWTPGPAMPEIARKIADFTPLGAASQAMQDSWNGSWPQPLHLVVMIAYALGLGALAVRLFRWE